MKSPLTLLFLLAFIPHSALATVTVSSPVAGSTVTSPVHYVATATASTCSLGVASMGVYVNNQLIYTVNGASLDTNIAMANGSEHTVVEEWDRCGGATFTTASPLPAGLTLSTGGVLSGTPTQTGSFPITVKVTDGNSCTGIGGSYQLLINPAPGQVGNLGLRWIEGPAILGLDMNLIKHIRITETKDFEIRVDSVNVLNHPNFATPTNTGGYNDITAPSNFGQLTTMITGNSTTAWAPRVVQLALRLEF